MLDTMLHILSKYPGEGQPKGEQVTHNNPNEASASLLPPQCMETAFLITASELRDRKIQRRRKRDLFGRSEAIRRLIELGLETKD